MMFQHPLHERRRQHSSSLLQLETIFPKQQQQQQPLPNKRRLVLEPQLLEIFLLFIKKSSC
jgi:hypothetical protein